MYCKLNLLDLNTDLIQKIDCALGNVTDIAFNNEGQMALSSGLFHYVTIWNLEKGILDMRLLGHSNQVLCVGYSPDGKIIASASMDNTIKIWNSKTGALEATLEGHTNAVSDVSFSSDNKYIVSASWDSTVKVWDCKTYRLLCTYKHENSVYSVVFSLDNKYILSASSGGIVVWDFPSLEELIGGVRERFRSRRLTPEEKQRYYLD